MIAFRRILPVAALIGSFAWSAGQQFNPPDSKKPDEATRKAIAAKMEKLEKVLAGLRKAVQAAPEADRYKQELRLADVEVYLKAAAWIMRHDEFYDKDSAAWTLETLDRGLDRANQLRSGHAPWIGLPGRTVIRAYRSPIDGSFQPYAITLPSDFDKDPKKLYRLDVVLHGRDSSLNEVKFVHRYHDKPAPKDQDFVSVAVYGRGNNAYRWAGEKDVIDAMLDFEVRTKVPIDSDRRVLRGFSMGGAGTWHIGLRRSFLWCVIGPGAGFTTTHGYVKGLPAQLPPYQEKCLHIYDAVDYAENAFNIPVVAYSGEKDAQKAAADNIEKRLRELKIPMTHLVAPGLAHQFPPEWQKKAEAEYARHVVKGRNRSPKRVRFVTYTLASSGCHWVWIEGLDRHYERTFVDAEQSDEGGFTVRTENVRVLKLNLPAGMPRPLPIHIDGQDVRVAPALIGKDETLKELFVFLERHNGRWAAVSAEQLAAERKRRLQKVGLNGPIDDAFTRRFLCVPGTGKPWHETTQKYAEGNLERFSYEWNKFLRGDLPIKNDRDVTAQDIQRNHLILFGDPASNSLIAKVLDKLPLKWTMESITFAGKTVPADNHVPVLIFPNPLNPKRYVVLNSGHTFHEADFRGTNALLYPRLGDYALLKLAPTAKDPLAVEVVEAGLFDDFWQIK